MLRLSCHGLDSPQVVGFVNVCAGGMFIGLALFHILPELLEDQPDRIKKAFNEDGDDLVVMMFVFLGFAMVLFFERVLFDVHGTEKDVLDIEEEVIKDVLNLRRSVFKKLAEGKVGARNKLHRASLAGDRLTVSQALAGRMSFQGDEPSQKERTEQIKMLESAHAHDSKDGASENCQAHSGPKGNHTQADSSIGVILIMIALSVHGFFEGTIVGTARDSKSIMIFGGVIVAHKWAEAFSITSQLSASHFEGWYAWILLLAFSLATPAGAVVGVLVSNAAGEDPESFPATITCVLTALALGSLFYIGMVEVVPEEFSGAKHSMFKFIGFSCSVAFVWALAWVHVRYGEHHHGDQHASLGHTHDDHHGLAQYGG
jgi:zinc transporter ZupT